MTGTEKKITMRDDEEIEERKKIREEGYGKKERKKERKKDEERDIMKGRK